MITALETEDQSMRGWLGPLELDPGSATDPVTVLVGGPGSLTVLVQDADTREPLDSVAIKLQPAACDALHVWNRTDGSGRVSIDGIPMGSFELQIDGENHHRLSESLESTGTPLEKTILLDRATWLVLELDDSTVHLTEEHFVWATVLSGDKPGWPHVARNEGRPTVGRNLRGPPARIKTRPGRFWIRFKVHKLADVYASPLFETELDVVVSDAGETRVTLQR